MACILSLHVFLASAPASLSLSLPSIRGQPPSSRTLVRLATPAPPITDEYSEGCSDTVFIARLRVSCGWSPSHSSQLRSLLSRSCLSCQRPARSSSLRHHHHSYDGPPLSFSPLPSPLFLSVHVCLCMCDDLEQFRVEDSRIPWQPTGPLRAAAAASSAPPSRPAGLTPPSIPAAAATHAASSPAQQCSAFAPTRPALSLFSSPRSPPLSGSSSLISFLFALL